MSKQSHAATCAPHASARTPSLAELIGIDAVAEICDCSKKHVRRMADAGRMPKPIKLGALLRWRRSELDKWLADGCPAVR